MGVMVEYFLEEMNKEGQEHLAALKGKPWPLCLLSHTHATLDLVLLPGGPQL